MAAKRSEKDFESSLKELECIVKQLEKVNFRWMTQ